MSALQRKRQHTKDEARRKAMEAEQLRQKNAALAVSASQSAAVAAARAASEKSGADSLAALTSRQQEG